MEEIKPVAPDYSEVRDEQVEVLVDALPLLVKSSFYHSVVLIEDGKALEIDNYLTIFGTQVLIDKSIVPQVGPAAATLARPFAVFRDFIKSEDTTASTYVETYFAIVKKGSASFFLSRVRQRKQVAFELKTAELKTGIKVGEIKEFFSDVSGLQTFKAF